MKAEDARKLYESAMSDFSFENGRFNGVWRNLNEDERRWLLRFARACERNVIERAKASVVEAEVTTHPRYRLTVERSVDWSALDDEITKENENG